MVSEAHRTSSPREKASESGRIMGLTWPESRVEKNAEVEEMVSDSIMFEPRADWRVQRSEFGCSFPFS